MTISLRQLVDMGPQVTCPIELQLAIEEAVEWAVLKLRQQGQLPLLRHGEVCGVEAHYRDEHGLLAVAITDRRSRHSHALTTKLALIGAVSHAAARRGWATVDAMHGTPQLALVVLSPRPVQEVA